MRKATTALTDGVLAWAVRQKLPTGWRYAIATAIVVAVAVVRMLYITPLLPWLPFIPAVILLTLLLGARFGFYAAALAALLAAITIARGHDPRQLTSDQWTASLLFIAVMAFMVFISGELRAAYRRNVTLLAQSDAREADLALLNAELGHRLKNQLTVVQAIVTQVIRRSASLEAAERAVSDRLSVLAGASDLLLNPIEGRPELEALIATVIAPLDIAKDRIAYDGGQVRLRREAALALALSIHELATNAVKYGALSNDAGRVDIKWSCEEDEDGTARLHFRWQEIGGPEVQKPVRRGFGTALLDRALRPYFKGSISTDFRPDGLVFEIDARLVPATSPAAK
jgi:two-component sensor histidine kinase